MATETDPAWLVALSRRSDAELERLPTSSQPTWYRMRVSEPRRGAERSPSDARERAATA